MPDELPVDAPLTRQEVGEVGILSELETTTPLKEAALKAFAGVPHEPGSAKPETILVADDVIRRFGGLTAVDVDHVEIQRGSITALIGPNGAGKTTFFNLLTGFDRPDNGSWTFNGRALAGMAAYKVARGGMVRTFQLTKALAKLTVIENMRLGAVGQRGESVWRAMFPVSGAAKRTTSLAAPRSCSAASSSTPNVTTSLARCPAGSASCSRWPGRSWSSRRW